MQEYIQKTKTKVKKNGFISTPIHIGVSSQGERGFTLVETLVALIILTIAITAPLSIIGNTLNATLFARDQMIATYLASEAIEIVKLKRDNNVMEGKDWKDGLGGGSPNCQNGCVISILEPAGAGDIKLSISNCVIGYCDKGNSKLSQHNASGLYGGAMEFDGNDSYVNLGNPDTLKITSLYHLKMAIIQTLTVRKSTMFSPSPLSKRAIP